MFPLFFCYFGVTVFKVFSRVIEMISKVDKSFSRPRHFTHTCIEEDCHIGNRTFKPISGHPLALFVTNVVNQGISHPSVGSALLLVSLLLLRSLDLTILQHNFVVSSYEIKIFLYGNSALFLLALCFLYFLFLSYCL